MGMYLCSQVAHITQRLHDKGKYMGTLEDVSHLDLIGWVNTARYKWAEFTGKTLKFKPASFYLEVASMLAEEVEGLKREDELEEDGRKETLFSASDDEAEISNKKKGKTQELESKKSAPAERSLTPPPGTIGGGVD